MASLSSPVSPTSPTVSTSTTKTPWYEILKKSYNRNFLYSDDPVLLSMSNIKRSGDVSMHCLQFQSFVEDDERFIVFHIALNDTLMGDIKSDPNARLCWTMPKSKEYFKFRGKFYIASSPLQVTRFPPPKTSSSGDLKASEFWEKERKQHWKALSDKARANFTWPSRGDCPRADSSSFGCQSLSHFDADSAGGAGLFGFGQGKNDKLKVVHDIAMDNYCLLVYKIVEVEHFDYSPFPPKRNLFTMSAKDNKWFHQELNP